MDLRVCHSARRHTVPEWKNRQPLHTTSLKKNKKKRYIIFIHTVPWSGGGTQERRGDRRVTDGRRKRTSSHSHTPTPFGCLVLPKLSGQGVDFCSVLLLTKNKNKLFRVDPSKKWKNVHVFLIILFSYLDSKEQKSGNRCPVLSFPSSPRTYFCYRRLETYLSKSEFFVRHAKKNRWAFFFVKPKPRKIDSID